MYDIPYERGRNDHTSTNNQATDRTSYIQVHTENTSGTIHKIKRENIQNSFITIKNIITLLVLLCKEFLVCERPATQTKGLKMRA